MDYDLKAFTQRLFDSMVWASDNGTGTNMSFAVDVAGEIDIKVLPKECEPALSSGAFKDELFGYWRVFCRDKRVRAWACGSWAWGMTLTEAGQALSEEKHRSLIDHGFVTLQRLGYATVHEALMVTAMTRVRVMLVQRRVNRDSAGNVVWDGEAEKAEISAGRLQGPSEDVGRSAPGEPELSDAADRGRTDEDKARAAAWEAIRLVREAEQRLKQPMTLADYGLGAETFNRLVDGVGFAGSGMMCMWCGEDVVVPVPGRGHDTESVYCTEECSDSAYGCGPGEDQDRTCVRRRAH